MVNNGKNQPVSGYLSKHGHVLPCLTPNIPPTTRSVAIVSALRLGPDEPPVSIVGPQTMHLVVTSRGDVMTEEG